MRNIEIDGFLQYLGLWRRSIYIWGYKIEFEKVGIAG